MKLVDRSLICRTGLMVSMLATTDHAPIVLKKSAFLTSA